ncbi:hypothetical protein J2S74_002822 [Evansella vedderi]|uniref:Uncharacterized protein n=1 Tax=Evansella vedderi TaxID=38282 RepID=A0ABT9ZWV6_9BACI|nr:hypothetical protein [Evansella vedderi]MDQ0255440.1 hypothetical protein [Evansella vedderi]
MANIDAQPKINKWANDKPSSSLIKFGDKAEGETISVIEKMSNEKKLVIINEKGRIKELESDELFMRD